ncbi:hypothetical protein ACHHYP_20319 [Achlya hypogyna]|uniref:Uncharacterized protein n=1 Tax=Achlya hypogyna TaxID=1202772 RepID=A0A1V9ZND5_ACHHY|nr:hypothetical protein ACHHYP_20319 [Achlya hypogyna]
MQSLQLSLLSGTSRHRATFICAADSLSKCVASADAWKSGPATWNTALMSGILSHSCMSPAVICAMHRSGTIHG